MRRAVLRTILLFSATAMAAQIATGIHLQEVYFTGNTWLEGVNLQKCAGDLKSKVYAGPEWTDYVTGVVQTQCLVDKGYLKPVVKASTQQLPDKNNTHQFRITFDINAGPRYCLGHITFKDNHVISDPNALRGLFPIKDGSVFDSEAIAKGLENLRFVYLEMGYLNFTSMPTQTFEDTEKVDSLEIFVDEGKQFRVSTIDIFGADVQVLNDLGLKSWDVYNVRLVNLFLQKQLPGADVGKDLRIQRRDRALFDSVLHERLNERNGTVALTFDFRSRTE